MSAAYRNLVLLFLTVFMEIILVCFLLSTLQRLPYQLESKYVGSFYALFKIKSTLE